MGGTEQVVVLLTEGKAEINARDNLVQRTVTDNLLDSRLSPPKGVVSEVEQPPIRYPCI